MFYVIWLSASLFMNDKSFNKYIRKLFKNELEMLVCKLLIGLYEYLWNSFWLVTVIVRFPSKQSG